MSRNVMLEAARHYRRERLTMNNPKGWAHVLRKVQDAYRLATWQVTVTEADFAFTVLRRLVRLEEETATFDDLLRERESRKPAQQRELELDIHYVGRYDVEAMAQYLYERGWRKQAFLPAVAVQPMNVGGMVSVELSSQPNIVDPYAMTTHYAQRGVA